MFFKRQQFIFASFIAMIVFLSACKKKHGISGEARSSQKNSSESSDQTSSIGSAITYEELALTEDDKDAKSLEVTTFEIDFNLLKPAFFMVDYDHFASSTVESDGKLKFQSEEAYALSDRCYQFVVSDKGMIYRPMGGYAFPESMIWDLKLTVITVGHFCTDTESRIKYFNNVSATAYDDPSLATSSFKSYLVSKSQQSLSLTNFETAAVKVMEGDIPPASPLRAPKPPPLPPPIAPVRPPRAPKTPPLPPPLPRAAQWGKVSHGGEVIPKDLKISNRAPTEKSSPGDPGTFPPPATAKIRSADDATGARETTAHVGKVTDDVKTSQVATLSSSIKTRELLPGERKVLGDKIETSINAEIQKLEISTPNFKTGEWDGVTGLEAFGSVMTRTGTRVTDSILSAGISNTGKVLPNAKELQNVAFGNHLLLAIDLKNKGNFPAYHAIIIGLSSPNLSRFDLNPDIKIVFDAEKKFATPTGKGFFTDATQTDMSKPGAVLSPLALKARLFAESEKIKVMVGNKGNLDPNDTAAIKIADDAIDAANKNFEALYKKALDELETTKKNGEKNMSFPTSKADEDKSIIFSTAPYDARAEEAALIQKKDLYPRLN